MVGGRNLMLSLVFLATVHADDPLLLGSMRGDNAQMCLPAASRVKDSRMRDLELYGKTQPLRLFRMKWTSGEIISHIFDILMREQLGVNTDTRFGSAGSSLGVMAVAGCKDTGSNAGKCTGEGLNEEPKGHVILTAWENYFMANWHLIPTSNPFKPLLVGSVGYPGYDGMFVPKPVITEAYAQEGMDLSSYLGYDAKWRNAAKYFDNIEELMAKVGTLKPNKCETLAQVSGEQPQRYGRVTNDLDGIHQKSVQGDGGATVNTWVMKCVDGWWYSPACRDDPLKKCIPIITTGTGWAFDIMAQQAFWGNMPVAISSWSWGDYVTVPTITNSMLYYWYPDATFITRDPQLVRFPKTNAKESRQFIFKSQLASQRILKLAVPELEVADIDVYNFVQDFHVQPSEVDDFIKAAELDLKPYFDVACDWIKDNEKVWSMWIPDMDRCAHGKGLSPKTGLCELCDAGFVSVFNADVKNLVCKTCRAGAYCTMGATHETPCDRGHFCVEGSSKPEGCGLGTYTLLEGQNASTACLACEPGTFASKEGTSMCEKCVKGKFAPEAGMDECVSCQIGTFQDTVGNAKCEECQDGFVTLVMGASHDGECGCAPGSFYSASADSCEECTTGLVCPGGREFPFVMMEYYAEPKFAKRSGQWSWNKAERTWTFSKVQFTGKIDDLFWEHQVWKCPFGDVACPGGTLKNAMGAEFKDVRLVDTCFGNDYECAQKQGCTSDLWKNGCTRCLDGFYFSRDDRACFPCTGGDGAIFPVLYIGGLCAMFAFYRFAAQKRSQKITSSLILASSFSIVVSFFQLLGVIGFYKVNFPSILKGFFDFCKLFVLDISVLKAACATGSNFEARFLSRTLSPLIFLGTFASFFPISQFVARCNRNITPINIYKLMNCTGIICSALYITLCKVSFQFFENASHPNAPGVLGAYADVDYDSTARTNMFPWAIISTMIYAVGIFSLTAYLCFVAPTKSGQDERFLMSTAFLTVRWNPNRWYWTLVVQTRNLFVALVGVWFPSTVILQLVMTGAVVSIYTALSASCTPWRDAFLSTADSVIGLTITLLCLFASVLVVEPREPEQKAFLQQAGLTSLTIIVVASILTFVYVVGVSLLYFFKPDAKRAVHLDYAMEVATTLFLVSDCITEQHKTPEQYAEELLHYMTQAEQKQMLLINKVVLHEVHGIDYQSAFENLSSKRMMSTKITEEKVNRKSFKMMTQPDSVDKSNVRSSRKLVGKDAPAAENEFSDTI